jgi:hypothetical protein
MAFVQGLPREPWLMGAWFLLGLLTLVFSMIIASRLLGGVGFGSFSGVLAKGGGLLGLVTALGFVNWGILVAGPVWFLGLLFLFRLDPRQARALAAINWLMMAVWKVLLLILLY